MKRSGNFNHYSQENNISKKPKLEIVDNQKHIYFKINELDSKINKIAILLMNIDNKLDKLIKQENEKPEFIFYT